MFSFTPVFSLCANYIPLKFSKMGCKGDSSNAKGSCWRREVFCQVTAGSWLVLEWIVELLVLFTGFFSPWFVHHLPWCPDALGGRRGTSATPAVSLQESQSCWRQRGTCSHEGAPQYGNGGRGLRKKAWEDGKYGFRLSKGKRNYKTLVAEDTLGYRNSSPM